MNYEEIFQKIYDALEAVGVDIGIIAWGKNHTTRARGDHNIHFTDDFQNVVSETILISECDIVRKIVLLLHEKGHSTTWRNMSPHARKLLCSRGKRNIIIEWEEAAWDLCWVEATQFGLHKDEDFVKIYSEEREMGLESYRAQASTLQQNTLNVEKK